MERTINQETVEDENRTTTSPETSTSQYFFSESKVKMSTIEPNDFLCMGWLEQEKLFFYKNAKMT